MEFAGIVLAAGEGKRLRPVTLTLPKTLAFLPGGTLLAHHLRLLREAGAGRVAVVVKHLAPRVADALRQDAGAGPAELVEQTGPEGLLYALRDALAGTRPPVLVVHGDGFLAGALTGFGGALALGETAIAVKPETAPGTPPGKDLVSVDQHGLVRAFGQRLAGHEHLESFGAYALGPAATAVIEETAARGDPDCDMIPVFRELLARGQRVRAVPWKGLHRNLNTAGEFLAASRELLARWNDLHHPRPEAGTYLGEGCTHRAGNSIITGPAWIGAQVLLDDAKLGPWVAVGARARLERVEIADAIVYPDAWVTDAKRAGELIL